MYTLETPPTGLPFTTRSSLQALLKSRGAISGAKRNKWILPKDAHNSQVLISGDDSPEVLSHQSDLLTPEADSQNGDQNGDFSYSQKLFHIDDGNLYSIFSPLQGRSYGMKPSFLRKQKCTVQECHGRGRKVLRKGLKFHNFLPSESVTSEKDNNIKEDQWKVHSECKLREEHGTKQIMVSNWFQNIKHTREDGSSSNSHSSESVASSDSNMDCLGSAKVASVYSFPVDAKSEMPSSTSPLLDESKTNSFVEVGKKFSVLNSLLHSVAKSQSSVAVPPQEHHKLSSMSCSGPQKRRRKPDLTRRVVPYTKYLSLMEENESFPLDLSLHANSDNDCMRRDANSKDNSVNENAGYCITTLPEKVNCDDISSHKLNVRQPPESTASSSLNQNFVYPIFPTLSTYIQPQAQQKAMNEASFENSSDNQSLFQYIQPFTLKKSMLHDPTGNRSGQSSISKSKARRKSQRSVIKQKLEDTFRQNGFLVKTKQVSDGDATFCKFRQLRKYTRYYLKSWQQHLPDEVHKMWKGFLPPKTVLPPISGPTMQHSVNEPPM